MQSTVSVSKGCFVFQGATAPKPTKSRGRLRKSSSSSLLTTEYKSQRWYQAYAKLWKHIQSEHEKIKLTGYTQTMDYLQKFVKDSWYLQTGECDTNLPATAILTGINQPDHFHLFKTFATNIRKLNGARACIIQSRDCPNIKSAIETMVSGLMDENCQDERQGSPAKGGSEKVDNNESMEIDDIPSSSPKLRQSQYTMAVLKAWYCRKNDEYLSKPILVVIIPDFENFHRDVLHQFILLLSHNYKTMPTALVLGVATDLATLHRTLSFSDANRLRLHVSQSQPSTYSLNEILDEIVLNPKCPLMLSAKVYTLLTDIFLYYDLAINSFMQGFKYCVMEHYNQGNAFAVCTTYPESLEAVKALQSDGLSAIRRLTSFRPYVESLTDCQIVIALLENDDFLRDNVLGLVSDIHIYRTLFYWALRVLLCLVQDLPKNLLGKHLRDIYAKCAANRIDETSEFQSSWELLSFMSKDELVTLLGKVHTGMCGYATKYCNNSDHVSKHCADLINKKAEKLLELIDNIRTAGTKVTEIVTEKDTNSATDNSQFKVQSRLELQAKLLEMSKKPKTTNAFTQAVNETLDYLRTEVVTAHLVPFKNGPPLLELFVFSDLSAIRAHIMGAPRAALHTGLNNPQIYLQCSCCVLDNPSQMVPTLPDLSIVYKLHLESGYNINLFDWMQAFRSIVSDDVDYDDDEPISPQIQARFTRAVAELQFLGFIKASKRKTDHVTRLTW